MTAIPSPPLLGQKALVLGIANEHSIAFGCVAPSAGSVQSWPLLT